MEDPMKTALIGAAMVSALTATSSYAATGADGAGLPDSATVSGEGASGGHGIKVASAAASTFLFVPEATHQSLLTTVAEGGEGGEGRRGARLRGYRYHYNQYLGRPHYYSRRDRLRHYDPRYDRPYYGRPHYDPYDYPSYRY
jgi:hypothetical protein